MTEEWFELEETTLGDEVMEYVEGVIAEAFSDLPDDGAPPWPNWLFGHKPEAEARGEYVTEVMAEIAKQAALEGGVGLAGDLAAMLGFEEVWAMIFDVSMTYAVRIALHSLIGYKHQDVSGIFFDPDYSRGSLISAVNEAVSDTLNGKEEDE